MFNKFGTVVSTNDDLIHPMPIIEQILSEFFETGKTRYDLAEVTFRF
jgi:hypothetical protein